MSQLRENLNPGLEGDRPHQLQHVQHEPSVNVNVVVDPPSPGDEAEGSGLPGGHDSDPPIENENPNEGDECFEDASFNSNLSSHERGKAVENARNRAQAHHRKRKKSVHTGDGNYIPPYKKNRSFRRQTSVLPSKFLLGGNIRDPLNLASLSDAKISAELNKVTPQSSPLPVQGQVPVFIPKNPFDPLGLTTATPENPGDIVAGVRINKCRKHRHRKRPGRKRTDSECSVGTELTEGPEEEQDQTKQKSGISEQGVPLPLSDGEDEVDRMIAEDRKRKHSSSKPPADLGKVESSSVETKVEGKKKQTGATEKVFGRSIETKKRADDNEKDKKLEVVRKKSLERKEVPTDTSQSTSCQSHKESNLVDNSGGGKASQSDTYPSQSSEYVPLSSTYAPSPFAFDSDIDYDVDYYGSPSFSCYQYTPTHELEPFSPPTRPDLIPPFERQMQLFASRPPQMSLQRAVFQRPFSRKRTRQKADPIVSPVVPQPGSRRRNHGHHHYNNHNEKKRGDKPSGNNNPHVSSKNDNKDSVGTGGTTNEGEGGKKYRPKDQVFQFGNYSQYYGYRTPDQADPRFWVLKKAHFEGKDVLDIGCNTGHVTLSIARDFEPRRVHGIDIDFSLITAARRNIKHYMTRDPENKNVIFPRSLPMIYGAMQPPPGSGESTPKPFPYNVSFAHENYVMSSDALLETVKPEYDVIICLSVTKWIHLNFGDDGLKRFFRRVFLNLRGGGKFVLEPQPWSSYTKKKRLTEKIHQMYKSIAFMPEKFEDFLIKDVGFASMVTLGTPVHHSKGFQRPLLMFTKANNVTVSPSSRSPFPVPITSTSPSKPVASSSKTASCTITSHSPQSPLECTSTSLSSVSNVPRRNQGAAAVIADYNDMPSSSSELERQQTSDQEITSTETENPSYSTGNHDQDIVSSTSDSK